MPEPTPRVDPPPASAQAARSPHAPRRRRVLPRLVALAGLIALLGAAAVAATWIAGAVRDEEVAPDDPPAPRAAEDGAEPKPRPKPRPLTAAQRRARAAAVAAVRNAGYEPVSRKTYDPGDTLRVLIGRRQGAQDGGRRAFFFVRDAYIGNDVPQDSGRLRVAKRSERQVTIEYRRYAPGDRACCPSAGTSKVRFRWDGSALGPRDPIPPAEQRTPAAQ